MLQIDEETLLVLGQVPNLAEVELALENIRGAFITFFISSALYLSLIFIKPTRVARRYLTECDARKYTGTVP